MLAISEKNVLDRKKANYLLNMKEAQEGRSTLESLPVALYVDINLDCNLKCPSCFRMDVANADIKWPTMDFELFENIAHTLFPTAYKVNLSGGGESLFHKRFDETLALCQHYKVRPYLYSNGTPITEQRAEILVRAGTSLGISIDGATKDTFETLRYPAKWPRMMEALGFIQEAQNRIQNAYFTPNLQIVVQRQNLHELPEFVDLAHRFGFPEIVLTKLSVDFEALEAEVPDPEEVNRMLLEVFERANEKGVFVWSWGYSETPTANKVRELATENLHLCKKAPVQDPTLGPLAYSQPYVHYPEMNSRTCGIPWSETYITPEGEVAIGCCSGFVMGDLRTTSFGEIWNGPLYQQLRSTVNTDQPWKPCRNDVCSFRF